MLIHRASPHKWGPGKTHFIDHRGGPLGEQKTLCGRVLDSVPGKSCYGQVIDVDCQTCLKAMRLRVIEAEN
jgi:hypothetical protein